MHLNPYLFLLLKRLIEVELFMSKGRVPSKEDIGYFIAEYIFKQPKPIKTHADHLRKIFSLADFTDIKEVHLDMMAKFPRSLVMVNSWQEFVDQESKSPDADDCDVLTDTAFSNCNIQVKLLVAGLVEKRVSEILAFHNYQKLTPVLEAAFIEHLHEWEVKDRCIPLYVKYFRSTDEDEKLEILGQISDKMTEDDEYWSGPGWNK